MLGSPGVTVEISGSRIANNSAAGGGGGLEVDGEAGKTAQLTIMNSILANNQAGPHGGAMAPTYGNATLTNLLVHENLIADGPASVLLASDSQVSIVNSTMADNNPQGHQAIILQSSDLDMTNSIMWNNALNIQAEPPCQTCVTVNYSDVDGECSWCSVGQGNIGEDPLFIDAATDNYRLGVGSPCIDNGTPAGAPAYDIEGTPRDGQPDMGAYEWTGYRIFMPLTVRNASP